MTLGKLVLYIGIIALVLTLLVGFLKKGHKSWVMSFLQNFCGVLFVISGWVKAIDPMGTAFKMEQYFTEFESTLETTWFGFVAPLFPWLSTQSIWVSVFMIVLEIVVGALLILGHRSRVTSWVFLLVILFFTVLTGFTFLTGYVPPGENFFAFGTWGPYMASNMRVTDCGCFGDFIKLDPRTSFMKDVVLLVPAFIFVFRHRHMHVLFGQGVRNAFSVILTVGLVLFCLNNFVWNEPVTDFRPFRVGVNIAAQKAAEEEAQASVQILTYKLKSKTDGRVVELGYDTYMKDYKSYPKQDWEVIGQTKTEPAIPATKISEFEMVDIEGNDMTGDILGNEDPVLLLVSYKLKGEENYIERIFQDSVYRVDTVFIGDSSVVVRSLDRVDERREMIPSYAWDEEFVRIFREDINPLMTAAAEKGYACYSVAGAAAAPAINSFREATGADYPMFEADDIMLKTIMRSNPGLLLIRDGTILAKWHRRHLPGMEDISRLGGK